MNHSTIRLGVALLLLALASRAQGQQILHFTDGWQSNPIGTALVQLGLDAEDTTSEQAFLDLLRSRRWDLVIVRRYNRLGPSVRNFVRAELEAHLDRGGALMFSIAQLDEMPEFWPMLSLADVEDLVLPLSDLTIPFPPHPSVSTGFVPVDSEVFGPDFGDRLVAESDAAAVMTYLETGDTAVVLSADGRTLVNGHEWDNWFGFSAVSLAKDQIRWLLSCPADLDGDGGTTVFDFLEFQNRFDSGGATGFADFSYDGRLDVFDFLEFLNLFDAGC